MAKKRGRRAGTGKVVVAAETIGAALGAVMAKVDAWMAQREEIAKELRAAADRIMSGESPFPRREGGGGVVRAAKARKRRMSAEARAKIAAAQRARWAKQKAVAAPGAGNVEGKSAKTSRKK
jgi:hypothetical protein